MSEMGKKISLSNNWGIFRLLSCSNKSSVDRMNGVDLKLCVNGVHGRWAADASIMSLIVSGAAHAPAIMIGEKASALVLEDTQPVLRPHSTKE